MKTAFTTETQKHNGQRLRTLFSVSLCLCGVLAVVASCRGTPQGEIDEKPDQTRSREAQSDFLDIGKQAGIEWLSFVPNDQRNFPELFEGLDSDQKRRLRLAPLDRPDERVLIEFKLPDGSKLWPVDWYGTELMAATLEEYMTGEISIAVARADETMARLPKLAEKRKAQIARELPAFGSRLTVSPETSEVVVRDSSGDWVAVYAARKFESNGTSFVVVVEVVRHWAHPPFKAVSTDHLFKGGIDGPKAARAVLAGISIKRDLALEGFPKHKCSSSVEDLRAGKLVFPGGTLSLPLKAGQVARKIGGDSTIQVDGEGAKPWLILRRLKESGAAGDIRTRVRLDTTFARRVEKPSGRFSAGQKLDNGVVVWDFAESGAEHQLVGVIATGTELLAVEVVSQGLTDADARRAARETARQLIGSAQADAAGEPLKVLEGWNVGTMGREK